MRFILTIFDTKLLRFVFAGIFMTLLGVTILYITYCVFETTYWVAATISYCIGGFLSFFINRQWVFNCKERKKLVINFVVNILVCYLIGFMLSRALTIRFLGFFFPTLSTRVVDGVALFIGPCFYTMLNYLGQRLWVFRVDNSR